LPRSSPSANFRHSPCMLPRFIIGFSRPYPHQ
jgi:hypothetical protein